MNYKTSISLIAFMAAIGLGAAAHASEYYRWVDENGVSHFSQQPPPKSQAEAEKVKVNVRTPSEEETAAAEEAVKKELKATKKVSTYDPKRCDTERKRLQTLRSGTRIRMPDGDGGFRFLEQSQINREMQKSQRAIQESCTQ